MNLLSLAQYTAFLLYLGLIILILAKNPKATLNIVCALLNGCFLIWSFATSFIYTAPSRQEALMWLNISSLGWLNLASFYLWFSLIYVKKTAILRKWYFYLFIFAVPALCLYKQWTGELVNSFVQQPYGLIVVWPNSIWASLFNLYYISFMLIGIGLVRSYGKRSKSRREQKQAKIMAISSFLALILGTLNNLLPHLKIYILPVFGPSVVLIWAGGIAWAITKYKLMVPTPAYAAADILNTMSDSLILIDPEGVIIEANPATLKLLGYSRKELIRRPVETLLSATEAPLFTGYELWEQLSQLKTFKDWRLFYRAKNGSGIPVSISGSVLRSPDDTLIGMVMVARDLREILRLQARERSFLVEKARSKALEEQARELQAAYDQLKTIQAQLIQAEKMAAVGQLAGGVAHEINNPMGIILGFAQSINQRITADHPLRLPLTSIEREAVRCKKLVGDLLTFSRAGKTRPEVLDVNAALDETLLLIEAQAKVKNVAIIRQYGTGLPPITFNKNQFQQVIFNICMNAIDAMPDGGRLTIGTGNHNPAGIEITINDTGQGMTEAVKNHLFEPFFTTKEIGKGTGLGLSLCYEIIRKNQGRIEVESEMGHGSTFTLHFPLQPESGPQL